MTTTREVTVSIKAIEDKLRFGQHLTNDEGRFLFWRAIGLLQEPMSDRHRCTACNAEGIVKRQIHGFSESHYNVPMKCSECNGVGYTETPVTYKVVE